jgi:hypothetical protein
MAGERPMSEMNEKQPRSLDDTNPFGAPVRVRVQKRRWLKWTLLGLVLLAVALSGFWLRRRPAVPSPAVAPAPAAKPLGLDVAQLAVNEITALEEIVYRKVQALAVQLEDYRTAGGTALVGFDLSGPIDACERIRQRAAALEREPKRAVLLAGLQLPLAEIGGLRTRIARLEARLGAPRRVLEGESHSRIVREYLRDVRGLAEAGIEARLRLVPLHEALLPGNKVWNLWLREGFFSFVTQGDAPLPLTEVLHQEQQRQRVEKEAALKQLNSLHYLVDTRERLIEKGVLSSKFLKSTQLDDLAPARFRLTLDLRESNFLFISARSLGLDRIDRITVFPKEFQAGRDYSLRISAGKRTARLHLLVTDRFRGQRLVVAVE